MGSLLPGNAYPAHLGNIHICQRSSRDICQSWSQFAEGIENMQHFDFDGCGQGEGGPDLNPSNYSQTRDDQDSFEIPSQTETSQQ